MQNMQNLELIEAPNPDVRSEVMSRAGELRSQGYDASDALSMAWSELEGDGADAGEDYDLMLETRPKGRRPRASNPSSETSIVGVVLIVGALAYFGACVYQWSKTKTWSWTPWKTTVPVSRRLPIARIVSRPNFDATIIDHHSVKPIYQGRDFTEETITLITP